MKYSIEQLIDGTKPKEFLFFWGHQPSKDGIITKSCFSQWWLSSFVVEEITYPSAEHWMMAKKAELFGDEEQLADILKDPSPANAKKYGRKVKNFDAEIWKEKAYKIVVEGNYHKFSQNPELKKFLLSTEEKVIIEASPVDFVWGIGLAENNPNVSNPSLWKGENLLGFALMEVRDLLK